MVTIVSAELLSKCLYSSLNAKNHLAWVLKTLHKCVTATKFGEK